MRLLQRSSDSVGFSLVERFKEEVPPYAILSHTWGSNEDEVTFSDMRDERSKRIPGYSKLVFCSERATSDKLEFFWVDTCCIDKSSSAELTEAINSMYKWYQQAEKCYVLLSDVEIDVPVEDISEEQWVQIFHSSRWFQRGWTLQEMLAPRVVEFFSRTGKLLGDKVTLLQALHLRTRIPVLALQSGSLEEFSIDERISWIEGRQTKREEDSAYSLLGLCDVYMPLIYGEGFGRALTRLRNEAERSLHDKVPIDLPGARRWTVPFRREAEFHHGDCLERVYQICSQNGGWASLIGPAGVGKTRLAIEYAYRVRFQTPTKWVFWINAETRASFREGFNAIAAAAKINHWNDPSVDICPIVYRWLCDIANGQWTMVVDNAEDADTFFVSRISRNHATADPISSVERLSNFLPISPNGSILFITRNRDFTRGLRGVNSDIANVDVRDYASFDIEDHVIPILQETPNASESSQLLEGNVAALQPDKSRAEPTAPRKEVPVYWTSRGKRMFDKYVDIDHGAVRELERELQARYKTPTKKTPRIFAQILRTSSRQGGDEKISDSEAERGECELQTRSDVPRPVHTTAAFERGFEGREGEPLRLLVCVNAQGKLKLTQEDLQHINDDRQLFQYLRKRLLANQHRVTLTDIRSFTLAKFSLDYNNDPVVYTHQDSCNVLTNGLYHPDSGFYCICLPPEEMVGNDKEYICNPAPGSRTRRVMPILGFNMLKQDLLDPDAIAAGQRTVLDQLPKRRLPGQLKAIPGSDVTGWGLYIEARRSSSRRGCCLFLFLAIVVIGFVLGFAFGLHRL